MLKTMFDGCWKNHSVGTAKLNIDGTGYECSIVETFIETFKNFFGAESKDEQKFIRKMSKEECFIMEFPIKCLGNVMICKDNRCLFSKPAHPAYHWLKTSYAYGLVCSLRYVNLQSENSKIYNCGIEDLECKTENSIFIWNKIIINKCPLKRLDSMSLNTTFDNIFSDSLGNLTFKIFNKSVYCDIEMFEPSEGLFLRRIKRI
ncbi:hypothetical protein BpHYR1_033489 [Brachionus plicatilis]|uniref:Uncharacterized protein n=1 Tax=Brachionus plicatilis TaxID=10195 RepID=A0A3M7QW32_BRAPC|nr:hypothetical protein BpHYR1_033489 [Brachionus plicatilis]